MTMTIRNTLERCPVCRARLAEKTLCPRCGSDIAPLVSIMAEGERWFQRSLMFALADRQADAIHAVQKAMHCAQTPLYRHWAAFLEVVRLEEQSLEGAGISLERSAPATLPTEHTGR